MKAKENTLKKNTLSIHKNNQIDLTSISLPASKSIANRALIINAMAGGQSELHNLSEARDTQTMIRLLKSDEKEWDVLDAGTTMRFLTAFAAVCNQPHLLTGTPRMLERPIKVLADSLSILGAEIRYQGREGYPPIEVHGLKKQMTRHLTVRGDISSQYISALLMIAPALPEGLTIELTGKVGSKPYISMTLAVMKAFGVDAVWNDNIIAITPQKYTATAYTIEPDWSAASYWYSIVAMSKKGEVFLKDIVDNSIQGDRKIADFMEQMGVKTTFKKDGALLQKTEHVSSVSFNFTDCPDLAQTVAVICSAKGIHCKMTGLESLRIKETDRIAALQTELAKIGGQLLENSDNTSWEVIPSDDPVRDGVEFATYHDHRMAMAFAPLSTMMDVIIQEPSVADKSYPSYWDDLRLVGFEMEVS